MSIEVVALAAICGVIPARLKFDLSGLAQIEQRAMREGAESQRHHSIATRAAAAAGRIAILSARSADLCITWQITRSPRLFPMH